MTFNSAFEESPGNRGFLRRMIVFSLLLHVIALFLSSVLSTSSPPKKIMSPNYTVDLVNPVDGGARGRHGGGSEKPVPKPADIPAAEPRTEAGRAELPFSRPIKRAEAEKSPARPMEKAVEKSVKREPSAPVIPSKPAAKAEKSRGAEPARGDAIEKILKRAESSPKAPTPAQSKATGPARGDAIEEILRRTDSERGAKPAYKGGAEASLGKAMDEIRKRVDFAERKQQVAGASSAAGTLAGAASGNGASGILTENSLSGAGSAAEVNARMYAYYRAVWARIKKHWTMSPGLLPKQNIVAVIHVRVLRNGSVEGINFEKRSGNAYFDESALRAVRKASPFPPLPAGGSEDYVEIGIRFHSSELR
ncbi:cell envelope integrity protein TolA [Syntrophus sp. (in: bacteria)]|jgi:TolA protein|uniref:cell envelope integrity protein TolA n=1 Tax=Syntrophus sp. (in: bacteria) TaxID=48412 RepID=UPI00345F0D00